jgi:hypothetical protein
MKKVIKLTESDLARIVKRVIKENDDYKDRSMYDPYFDDEEDEDLGEVDPNEPYDSIGGHSVNDLKKAFKNIGVNVDNVDLEQRFEDLIQEAFDLFEEEGISHEEYIMYSEEDVINAVREFDLDLAEEMSEIWNQIG